MAARAATAWEAGLDPRLVARLARPLRRPGLVSLAIVRRIHGGIEALFARLSLLERFAHKVRELAAPETPIVHARPVVAPGAAEATEAAEAASAAQQQTPRQVPIVRASERTVERVVERTILVEKRDLAAPSGPPTHAAPAASGEVGEGRPPVPVPAGTEAAGARTAVAVVGGRRDARERIELAAPAARTAPAASAEHVEPAPPAARRSRMGAPIVRRAAAPAPDAAPLVVSATRPPEARGELAPPGGAPGPRAPVVSPRRQGPPAPGLVVAPSARAERAVAPLPVTPSVTAPRTVSGTASATASIVHARAAAPRAPSAPEVALAASPVVSPRARAARPELELPLAHSTPAARASAPAPDAARAVPVTAAPAPGPLAVAPAAAAAPPRPPPPKLDLHDIADRVQHILARRAMQERERRGLPR